MTCTTCGRENPPHLTFCQECGQRLGPRIAPPTPPIGLPGHEAFNPPPRVATSLGMPERGATPAPPVAAPAGGGDRRCKICDTVNAPNLRYCTSCGSTLDGAPAPAAAAPAPPPPAPTAAAAPLPPPTIEPPGIAPMRVVDLGTPPVAEGVRICGRCRGAADGTAQFCKFCGAPLEGRPIEPRAEPSPAVPPLMAHERLELPRTNGRAPTAPMAEIAAPVPVRAPEPPSPARSNVPVPSPAPSPSPIGAAAALASLPRASAAPQPQPQPQPRAAAGVQRGRLVVIAKSGADGPSYPFGDVLDVGRVEGNVIVAEDPYLSPRHVRIAWTSGKVLLRDLASTNGVFLRLAPSRDTTPRKNTDSPEVAVPLIDGDFVLVASRFFVSTSSRRTRRGSGPPRSTAPSCLALPPLQGTLGFVSAPSRESRETSITYGKWRPCSDVSREMWCSPRIHSCRVVTPQSGS